MTDYVLGDSDGTKLPPVSIIDIEISGTCTLTPEEVWPDGVPVGWTVEDVEEQMKKSGPADRLISEWYLPCEIIVHVDRPNPYYVQEEVLFGDPPSPRIREKVVLFEQ